MVLERAKQAQLFGLAFGCEVASNTTAFVDHAGACRLREHGKRQNAVLCDVRGPRRIVQIKSLWRRGFVDAVEAAFGRHRFLAIVVLVGDCFPTRRSGCINLIGQNNACAGQVVEQRFQIVIEKR